MMQFVGPKREQSGFGPKGWWRDVEIDGTLYIVGITRGERVRIPYRPRGKNIGYKWYGVVREKATGKEVFSDRFPKSTGAVSLIHYAGLTECIPVRREGNITTQCKLCKRYMGPRFLWHMEEPKRGVAIPAGLKWWWHLYSADDACAYPPTQPTSDAFTNKWKVAYASNDEGNPVYTASQAADELNRKME